MDKCGCDDIHIGSQLDVNTSLKLLSSPMCRHLLRELSDRSDNVAYLDDLVDSYIERTVDKVARERVEVQCHHQHLPALSDAGIVEFDQTSGAVRYYPNKTIEELLDVIAKWEE